MVAHSVIFALLAVAPAASPETSAGRAPTAAKTDASQRSPQQLRDAVRAALRRQATAKGADQDAAVRQLTAVYQELTRATRLAPRERRQLRAMVRSRLLRTSKALKREIARNAKQANKNDQAPPAERKILAQIQPNAPGQPNVAGQAQNPNQGQPFGPGAQVAAPRRRLGRATNRNAQELIDLIQNVIAPSSWDVNGGLGTIMYFAPKQVLVIRARGDIHDQVGEAIEGLRGK